MKRIERPGVREGYDRWADSYDATPNPLVALDRRVTLSVLRPRPGERVLDAGCGTGAHLAALCEARSRAFGLDFSRGMLRVAQQRAPGAALAQADLNRELPVRRRAFDAVLSALVSEHLMDLRCFFQEAFCALRRGGRLVFSAFHPDLARAGIEANFEQGGTEYRLGAERYTVADYLDHISDAGSASSSGASTEAMTTSWRRCLRHASTSAAPCFCSCRRSVAPDRRAGSTDFGAHARPDGG